MQFSPDEGWSEDTSWVEAVERYQDEFGNWRNDGPYMDGYEFGTLDGRRAYWLTRPEPTTEEMFEIQYIGPNVVNVAHFEHDADDHDGAIDVLIVSNGLAELPWDPFYDEIRLMSPGSDGARRLIHRVLSPEQTETDKEA